MSLLDNAAFRAYLGRRILCQVETREKVVALTFDDGPNPVHTTALLDMLARKRIAATFFVVGRRVRRFGEIVARAASEGHQIENHTDLHVPLSLLPAAMIRRELCVTGELILRHTGRQPRFVRPPMGWFNNRVLSLATRLGYRPVIGSVHPRDSRKPGTAAIVERVMRRVFPGAIVILHDGGWRARSDRRQSVEAADRITDALTVRGFRFATLEELVHTAGSRP